jgi:predicted dehydrogenase
VTLAPIGVAVVGAGAWGANHVRTLHRLPGARLVAVCDRSAEVLRSIGSSFPEVRCVSEVEDLLRIDEVRAVVVATSAGAHHAVAKACVEAGRDVLVEKPLTLSTGHSEDLVRLASDAKRVLMVGHLLLFHPAIAYLKRLIAQGDLGEVRYIYSQRVNLGTVRSDENAWWSLAPHDISVANHLLDSEPLSVSARGQAFLQPGVHDVVFANLAYPDGKMANVQVSWLDPHKIRRFTIVGSQKMAVFDDMESVEKVRIYDKGIKEGGYVSYGESLTLRFGDIHIPRIPMTEPLRAECEHFLDCVRTRKTPITHGAQGLSVVRTLNGGQESLLRMGEPRELGGAT